MKIRYCPLGYPAGDHRGELDRDDDGRVVLRDNGETLRPSDIEQIQVDEYATDDELLRSAEDQGYTLRGLWPPLD